MTAYKLCRTGWCRQSRLSKPDIGLGGLRPISAGVDATVIVPVHVSLDRHPDIINGPVLFVINHFALDKRMEALDTSVIVRMTLTGVRVIYSRVL